MSHTIHPETKLGYIHLTVTNLNRSLDFYQQVLGFKLHRRQNGTAHLGAGQADLLLLTEQPQARRVRGTVGLYHFAILVPSRLALAQSLKQIAETNSPVQGFADHLVSEAIYLPDPDGNGIEIYRDRPRAEWPMANGQLQMATDPLDVEGVLAELSKTDGAWSGLQPDTVLGHVHLHVANIPQAEAFYRDLLGFDLMLRYGPSASFLAAGGYHHHIGINTWAGSAPRPADATGMRYFVIQLPNQAELNRVTDRLKQAGLSLAEQAGGLLVRDPVQNGVVLAAVP